MIVIIIITTTMFMVLSSWSKSTRDFHRSIWWTQSHHTGRSRTCQCCRNSWSASSSASSWMDYLQDMFGRSSCSQTAANNSSGLFSVCLIHTLITQDSITIHTNTLIQDANSAFPPDQFVLIFRGPIYKISYVLRFIVRLSSVCRKIDLL